MTEGLTYQIEIDVYKGPFDLLLQGIDEGRIDIYRVSLSQITRSYFEYWKGEGPELVIASDFLYMAAYLMELKSKSLLPAREEIIVEEDDVSNVEEALLSHIEEIKIYKALAHTLKQRKEIFERVYGRHEGEGQEKEIELVDVSLRDLVLAFKRIYTEAAKRERVVAIKNEEITLEERVIEVKKLLSVHKEGVPFEDIFIRGTRLEIVVTFLAILELAKQRFVRIAQGGRFGTILLFAKGVEEYGIAAAAGQN